MAPEQVRGEVVDRRADLFALGAVLYEMLAGRRAFKGDSTLGTLDAVLTLQPPDLWNVYPGIPPALSQIVRRCLANSPDDRFATAADVVSALDSVIRARNPPAPPTLLALFRRPVVMVTVLLVIFAMGAGGGKGPAPVGSYDGLGPFGTYDMAGNVKEWCWTETNHRRFLLGGAWSEPRHMFADYDARGPFERAPGYGFRLAKYIRPLPAAVAAPVRLEALVPDPRKHKPVGDDIFAVYRRQYAYDHGPLNAVVEATEEAEFWLKHTVAFDAAYGGERMRAYLFLPTNGSPPYQTGIFFPAADAFILRSSRDISVARGDFIIRSGRAFLYPVYKGTYERPTSDEVGSNEERELRIAWSRDLGRAIDYLETRSDIDRTRLAFYGVSAGADAGVILTALEPRLKTSVLQGTGIWDVVAPEMDSVNYAPRVRIPTLMLNGRYDFETPTETAQRPLFDLLAAEHKQHTVFESGHALPIDDVASEILPWLDRYLGPVVQSSPASTRIRAGATAR